MDKSASTSVGKIIVRRKELDISQEEVAKAVGKTKQWWSNIESKYQENPEFEYHFTHEDMQKLNQLLRLDEMEAIHSTKDPMVFNEYAILQDMLEQASRRDFFLTQKILECLCSSTETDLRMLELSTVLLTQRNDFSFNQETALLISAIRTAVTQIVQETYPSDDALKRVITEKHSDVQKKLREGKIRAKVKEGTDSTADYKKIIEKLSQDHLTKLVTKEIMDKLTPQLQMILEPAVRRTISELIHRHF